MAWGGTFNTTSNALRHPALPEHIPQAAADARASLKEEEAARCAAKADELEAACAEQERREQAAAQRRERAEKAALVRGGVPVADSAESETRERVG